MATNGVQGSYNTSTTVLEELRKFKDEWVREMLISYAYNGEGAREIDKFLSK
jgi:hypothetical protein